MLKKNRSQVWWRLQSHIILTILVHLKLISKKNIFLSYHFRSLIKLIIDDLEAGIQQSPGDIFYMLQLQKKIMKGVYQGSFPG